MVSDGEQDLMPADTLSNNGDELGTTSNSQKLMGNPTWSLYNWCVFWPRIVEKNRRMSKVLPLCFGPFLHGKIIRNQPAGPPSHLLSLGGDPRLVNDQLLVESDRSGACACRSCHCWMFFQRWLMNLQWFSELPRCGQVSASFEADPGATDPSSNRNLASWVSAWVSPRKCWDT